MINKTLLIRFFIVICVILQAQFLHSQNALNYNKVTGETDTLILSDVIRRIVTSYPSVREAEESIRQAQARINLAKTGYYPNLDFNANYTRIGPVSTFDIPGLGNFKLFPEDNYSVALNISDNILDFGKTSKNVDYESENKILAAEKVEQAMQSLSMSAIGCFYSLAYLQHALEIKDEELRDLNGHLEFIEKKIQTGSGTDYELLSTKVRISNVESQKIDLESSLEIQQSVLNSLLGAPAYTNHIVKEDTTYIPLEIKDDSLFSYAYSHRDEMIISKENTEVARMHYNVLSTQNYPIVSLFTSGGWKNGYIPDLNTFLANFAAGITVTLPIFDAGRNKNNLLVAESSIKESDFETELIRRKIENEVVESLENLNASRKKLDHYTLQLQQAVQAHSLAETNYRVGAITNLDLLDAETNVSESKLLVLKASIDNEVYLYKLKSVIGEKLY